MKREGGNVPRDVLFHRSAYQSGDVSTSSVTLGDQMGGRVNDEGSSFALPLISRSGSLMLQSSNLSETSSQLQELQVIA